MRATSEPEAVPVSENAGAPAATGSGGHAPVAGNFETPGAARMRPPALTPFSWPARSPGVSVVTTVLARRDASRGKQGRLPAALLAATADASRPRAPGRQDPSPPRASKRARG